MENSYLKSVVQAFAISINNPPKTRFSNAIAMNSGESNNPNGLCIFQPGDTLKGTVTLLISGQLYIQNFSLFVNGAVVINNNQPDSQQFNIFTVATDLLPVKSARSFILSPGEHVFPFEFLLPNKCPSTINMAPNLTLDYFVKSRLQAAANEHLAQSNVSQLEISRSIVFTQRYPGMNCIGGNMPFQVDLQHQKMNYSNKQYMNLMSRIKGFVQINKRAFEQGENIVMNLEVTNTSHKKTISAIVAQLIMYVCYQSVSREIGIQRKTINKTAACVIDHALVGHKGVRKWRDIKMQVPEILPTSGNNNSQIYSVEYKLVFEVRFQGVEKQIPLATIPIVIGVQTVGALEKSVKMSNGTRSVQNYGFNSPAASNLTNRRGIKSQHGSAVYGDSDFYF